MLQSSSECGLWNTWTDSVWFRGEFPSRRESKALKFPEEKVKKKNPNTLSRIELIIISCLQERHGHVHNYRVTLSVVVDVTWLTGDL